MDTQNPGAAQGRAIDAPTRLQVAGVAADTKDQWRRKPYRISDSDSANAGFGIDWTSTKGGR